jgi:sugar O-acyltransferase (sialic acid O-acetyltransferase NeuD family)
MAEEMVLWGATGQAKVLRECLAESGLRLVAVFDNNPDVQPPFPDVALVIGKSGFEDWVMSRSGAVGTRFLVAIGGQLGRDRIELQDYLESFGLSPLIARHPTAYVASNAVIGAGSQVLANAAVCVDATLGRGCIVNTGATVDHDCRLGDGVHIAPGAHLAGNVTVEAYATVFTGAVVAPRVRIGQGAVVGAGAVVLKDVPAGAVVAGNPARILASHG